MYNLDHILVALDLSDMDDFLIRYSNFIAGNFQPQSITFLHVMQAYDIPKELMAEFPDMESPLRDMVREELEDKVKELFQAPKELDVHIVVEEGVTTETIVQYTQEKDITLTLMGKKIGYEGRGSVVRKVLSITPSSVLLISETSQPKIDHVLVRMDFTRMAGMALKMAVRLKELTNAKISCHHVSKLPLKYFSRNSVSDEQKLIRRVENYSQKEFQRFLKRQKLSQQEIDCSSSLDYENEEAHILYNKALSTAADMIIIGTKIKSEMADVILESTSEKLAGPEKNIPVFVVKDRKQTIGFLEALFD